VVAELRKLEMVTGKYKEKTLLQSWLVRRGNGGT